MSCILGLLDGKEGGKSNTYTHIYNINIQVKRRRLGCKGCRLAERIMQNGENLFRLSIVNGTSHLLRSNLYWLGFLDKFGATISKMFEAIWKEPMEEPGKKSAVPLYCQGTLRMHTLRA